MQVSIDNEFQVKVLDALQIPYLHLVVEQDGEEPDSVVSLTEDIDQELDNMVTEGNLDPETAGTIKNAKSMAKIAKDWGVIREIIAAYKLPEQEDRPFRFVQCTTCKTVHRHGYIQFHGLRISLPLATLFDGIMVVEEGIEGGHIDMETGISLLKDMVTVNLPGSEHEMEARYKELPADVRERYEAREPSPLRQLFSSCSETGSASRQSSTKSTPPRLPSRSWGNFYYEAAKGERRNLLFKVNTTPSSPASSYQLRSRP